MTLDSVVDRRKLLFGAGAVGAGAVLAACTSNTAPGSTTASANLATGNSSKPGKHVTIGFSAPAADHGWTAAITKNAQAQAKTFSDVTLELTQGTNDVNQQIAQIKTLMNKKVDALAILPFDGKSLTQIARQAMDAGIPVVNIDRIFASPQSYRTWVGGDNYGMGLNAGNFIGDRLKGKGRVVEIAGIDNLQLTQDRSRGFKDALGNYPGLKLVARQAADFTPAGGQQVMANVLSAVKNIDAVWNHDDDQGIGVEAAIKQAGRGKEFFMVGGAGSKHALQEIKDGTGVLVADVLYPPTMAASAVSLARLIAQGGALNDLAQLEVPGSITVYSAVVTKANVDKYLPYGFA